MMIFLGIQNAQAEGKGVPVEKFKPMAMDILKRPQARTAGYLAPALLCTADLPAGAI